MAPLHLNQIQIQRSQLTQPIQMKKLNQKIQLTQLDQNQGLQAPYQLTMLQAFNLAPKITSDTKDYYAQIQTFKDGTTGPNYVQVTDKRGTQEGWTLSAVQNGQFKTAQNEELVGPLYRLPMQV